MQNSIVVFTFAVLDWKCPFRANLVQKVKIIILSWNLVASLIWLYRTRWCCSLFWFLTGDTLFMQILFKNGSCQFKLKFGTQTNSIMQSSIVMFTFSIFLIGNTFFRQFWSIKLSVQAEILYILIASTKIPESKGSISLSSFYGQPPKN